MTARMGAGGAVGDASSFGWGAEVAEDTEPHCLASVGVIIRSRPGVMNNFTAETQRRGEKQRGSPQRHSAAKPQANSDQLSAVSSWMRAVNIRLISMVSA